MSELSSMDVYIAGPFFNPPQVELIERIERHLTDAGFSFISPRLQPANKSPITASQADEIFKRNLNDITRCNIVLACVDWLMPKGQTIVRIDREADIDYFAKPLSLPDSGTVFEMGLAVAWDKMLVLYTERRLDQPLNVMLSRAGPVIRNWIDLTCFFGKNRAIQPGMLSNWEGKNL